MAKRKADTEAQASSLKGSKKTKLDVTKKSALLDSDSGSSSDESDGGAKLEGAEFKINAEFAKRFEHNKKREELQRLEEKYQKSAKPANGKYGDKYDEDSETSSTEEDEDDDGFLATEALDAEISATLQALRSKDPRVYDEKITFYAPIEEGEAAGPEAKKEKPMYLTDYHRENLLKGNTGAEDEEEVPPTFAQEQADLKKSIVKEMHAGGDDSSEDEDGGFLVPKPTQKSSSDVHPSRASKVRNAKVDVDVAAADRDPETFLSNFMAARAWVPSDGARFQPFESDDEEEDERADKFEAAYNLRFEDPNGSNEMLKSYARDVIAAKSVRREEPNSRKKQRDTQREKREAEKAERDEDRARLRRLKIEEMEEKLQKIKKAAGIRGKMLKDEEWTKFLDEGWEDDQWETEMNKQFGEEYYAAPEAGSEDSDEDDEAGSLKKKKPKKPKWDDDIDIQDLIPDFVAEESTDKPAFTLSDSEHDDDNDDADSTLPKKKTSKDRQAEKQAKKKAARLERKKIEDLVDSHMDIDLPLSASASASNSKQPARFRYRETSPISFGLTARDILMAPDSQLNQFAGLKKMASFRDADKKRKDKKHLGKKARLRQWRKETFGNENGPEIVIGGAAADLQEEAAGGDDGKDGVDIVEGASKKKKRRSKKSKGATAEVEA